LPTGGLVWRVSFGIVLGPTGYVFACWGWLGHHRRVLARLQRPAHHLPPARSTPATSTRHGLIFVGTTGLNLDGAEVRLVRPDVAGQIDHL
jgi:hypothetical protein